MISSCILIVLPNLNGGGAERLHINLANYWVAKGYQVKFVLMSLTGDLFELVDNNVEIIDLKAQKIKDIPFKLSSVIKKTNPNFIIAAMWPLTCAAFVGWIFSGRQGKLFLSEHTALIAANPYETKTSLFTIRLTIRICYRFASGLIAVSKGIKNEMCQLAKIEPSKVQVIYNPVTKGIDINEVYKADNIKLWDGHDGLKILSVGSLKTQKNHETLLRAIKLIPSKYKAKLIIIGEGPLREHLLNIINQLEISNQVSMPGFIIDPYPWFASADIFVLSSRWEGFGNVIVEALECGTQVVSTNCFSGPSEILDNGRFGQLVPVQDPESMALAIEKTYNNKIDRNILTVRAKEFSIERISQQYLNYFLNT